jgi:hypothetical protein
VLSTAYDSRGMVIKYDNFLNTKNTKFKLWNEKTHRFNVYKPMRTNIQVSPVDILRINANKGNNGKKKCTNWTNISNIYEWWELFSKFAPVPTTCAKLNC